MCFVKKFVFNKAEIGALSIVMPRVVGKINNLKVGTKTFVSEKSEFVLHNCITVGDMVVINDGVKILTASHDVNSQAWEQYSKPVVIKNYAWIATNSIILPGVTIGEGAVVGAGSVVSKDVLDGAVVVGNPIRIVGHRAKGLNYNPVGFSAPFEAWIGKEIL